MSIDGPVSNAKTLAPVSGWALAPGKSRALKKGVGTLSMTEDQTVQERLPRASPLLQQAAGALPLSGSVAHKPTTTASQPEPSRRSFLETAGAGFGAVALNWMLHSDSAYAAGPDLQDNPLTHNIARARSVIFLFMEGGPSHLDLVDPKPLLNKLAGQPLPASFKEPITAMGERGSPLLASPRKWKQHGESGLWASEWMAETAKCMDDIAVIRSCWTNGINHAGGVCQMNTCINVAGRPSLGSWVNYGLGSGNENLPSFVVMCDSTGRPVNGPRNWGSGFMPATWQGVRLSGGKEPIPNLNSPKGYTEQRQREKLEMLQWFNLQHAQSRSHQSELEARIRSYELAFRMQAQAPEAVDLAAETQATQQLYGLDNKATQPFGRICLLPDAWSNAVFGSYSFTAEPAASGIHTLTLRRNTRRCVAVSIGRLPGCFRI